MDAHTELEVALQQAAQDPACRPAFFRLLLASEVFVCAVPGKPAGDDGEQTLSLRMWSDDNGAPRLPFFTRLELLQGVIHEQNDAVAINARTLFEMTTGATLFLNPGEVFGKEFRPAEIVPCWKVALTGCRRSSMFLRAASCCWVSLRKDPRRCSRLWAAFYPRTRTSRRPISP